MTDSATRAIFVSHHNFQNLKLKNPSLIMSEEKPAESGSSWWGYASTAWNSIQETAKDFTDALQTENEETIQQIKETVDSEKIQNQISTAKTQINSFLNTTMQTVNETVSAATATNDKSTIEINSSSKKQIAPKYDIHVIYISHYITSTFK